MRRFACRINYAVQRKLGDIVGSIAVRVLDTILGPAEPFEYVSTTTPESVSDDFT
jgi:hypothetical protein